MAGGRGVVVVKDVRFDIVAFSSSVCALEEKRLGPLPSENFGILVFMCVYVLLLAVLATEARLIGKLGGEDRRVSGLRATRLG